MNARSALFDLYGDHLRDRGGTATIASLVRLLAALGIAAPAVRTAVSRMVRQGWLEPVRLPAGSAYAVTPRAERRLDEAAHRIYRDLDPWDGHWQLLVIERVRERARRDRLAAGLAYLGYAPLNETTWIGPRPSPELDSLLDAEQVRAERFRSAYDGDARGLVARGWDLDGLGRAYERWLREARALTRDVAGTGPGQAPGQDRGGAAAGPTGDVAGESGDDTATTDEHASDERAFAVRSRLVHEWRKFLFRDPGLPPALLPPDWPGTEAACFFDAEAARLLPGASRFVDRCLQTPPRP